MRVRLLSDRWRQPDGDDYRYYVKGDEVEVSDGTGEWLIKSGAAVDLDAEPEPGPEPAQEPESQPEPEETSSEDVPERPKNAANKDIWVDYYRKVKREDPPKSMSREEIIAAVG